MSKDIILEKMTGVMKDGVQIINEDGVTTVYNRKIEIIENRKASEVLGNMLESIEQNESDNILLDVLQTGLPQVNQIYKGINAYGKEIICNVSYWPINENNEIIGAIKIMVDVTEIKTLRNKVLGITKDLNQIKQSDSGLKLGKYSLADIIGESNQMQHVRTLASIAATSDANVMIYGESGTGKELVAQGIHSDSKRKDKPLIAENCAAIPGTLMESILFGTAKGGFTGAVDRPGLFQLANGGTIILDEINSLDIGLQAKLLRVLQEGTFRPIGSVENKQVDIRIIAISNKRPEEMIAEGTLRQDLFYRLNVIDIFIPPLRERDGDIELLTRFFLEKHGREVNKFSVSITDEVKRAFKNYNWHGNVRELSNVIECGVNMILDKNIIELEDLPMYFKERVKEANRKEEKVNSMALEFNGKSLSLSKYLNEIEQDLIKKIILECDGNITKAAEKLGISRQGLQQKIKKKKI